MAGEIALSADAIERDGPPVFRELPMRKPCARPSRTSATASPDFTRPLASEFRRQPSAGRVSQSDSGTTIRRIASPELDGPGLPRGLATRRSGPGGLRSAGPRRRPAGAAGHARDRLSRGRALRTQADGEVDRAQESRAGSFPPGRVAVDSMQEAEAFTSLQLVLRTAGDADAGALPGEALPRTSRRATCGAGAATGGLQPGSRSSRTAVDPGPMSTRTSIARSVRGSSPETCSR